MKKSIFSLIFLVLVLSGCKKFDKLTQFDIALDETIEIPSLIGINLPFNILSPNIETNSETSFAVNDTRKELVEEIRLTTLSLRLTNPANADFSFLESVTVYISAQGLPEIKIAWDENIASGTGDLLKLKVSKFDLKDYIKKDQVNLRLNTVTDEILTSDHIIDVHAIFYVDAKILGQ